MQNTTSKAITASAGHSTGYAFLRYQRAAENRDALVARLLGELASNAKVTKLPARVEKLPNEAS